MDLIKELGGSLFESYPEDVVRRKVSGSVLRSGTLAMFQAAEFAPERWIGKDWWEVWRVVLTGASVAAVVS